MGMARSENKSLLRALHKDDIKWLEIRRISRATSPGFNGLSNSSPINSEQSPKTMVKREDTEREKERERERNDRYLVIVAGISDHERRISVLGVPRDVREVLEL